MIIHTLLNNCEENPQTIQIEQKCILFCVRKTRTGLTYFEVTCSGRVSSGWGHYTLLKFLRHLLFTQLQIPKVMLGRMVSIVSEHERIQEWMYFCEKVDQSFTID